jgi:heme d1 biosynthesis radical SAM protein NirJ
METLVNPKPLAPHRKPAGPVVIWNLIRRCNLTCKHCYTTSADIDFKGELDTREVKLVMDDLYDFKVPMLILSGGEPLLRPDIFEVSRYAKEKGFMVSLSTNGTLITEKNIDQIADMNYDYVGVSLDGIRETHDKFRQKEGSFEQSLHGIQLCKERGIKVGIRFTLTLDNYRELPSLLAVMDEYDIDKFYLSHLNYSGRGLRNKKSDVYHNISREALELLFVRAWREIKDGIKREYVTGNNDADGVFLLHWAEQHFPDQLEDLATRLKRWGGNSTGINVANIDNLGNVHPDTFWWNHNLGNVRERPFSAIWSEPNDAFMAGLRQNPRPLQGRCGVCHFRDICGGNTRVRAFQMTGDYWAEDPACYLTDEEIGIVSVAEEEES